MNWESGKQQSHRSVVLRDLFLYRNSFEKLEI